MLWAFSGEINVFGQAISYDNEFVRVVMGLDRNGNRSLEDEEIQAAVRLWITGERVPIANQIVTDKLLMRLIQLWVSAETMPVCGLQA